MKIILLVMAICLLLKTFRSIPSVFSNKRFAKSLNELNESAEKLRNDAKITKENLDTVVIVITYILTILLSAFYLGINSYIKETPILVLTIVNLCRIFLIGVKDMKYVVQSNYTSHIKLYTFRLYRFINLLINLSYYGLVIYYLFILINNK
jgi:hypothetical protein